MSVTLRAATPEDVDFLTELYAHEDVRPFLAAAGSYDRDGVAELVAGFGDPRIAYRANDATLGITANWNRCLDLADTELVTLLHADDQLGPEYSDINWRQYDPRQYDPRRIVREALIEPLEDAASGLKSGGTNPDMGEVDALGDDAVSIGSDLRTWDPQRPTPYDVDAT